MIAASPPIATPLRLTRLTRNEAQALSQISQRAQRCEITLLDQNWLVTVQVAQSDEGVPAQGSEDWKIRVLWAGALFDIYLPGLICEHWMDLRFAELDLPTLPIELSVTLLESVADSLLQSLRALQRGPVRMESISREGLTASSLPHTFNLRLEYGEQLVMGSLQTDGLGLMLMAGLIAKKLPAINDLDTGLLPVRLRAEIGRSALKASQLLSLGLGDTVLIGHPWISQDGGLWMVGQGDAGVRVRWDDHQLIVTQVYSKTGFSMTQTPSSEPTEHAIAIDSVPVYLCFDLGERQIPLSELQALQVGQAMDLGRPLSQSVNIRANGALIGTGELIDIDGRLGVTIKSLSDNAKSAS